MKILEDCIVRYKCDQCAVAFTGLGFLVLLCQYTSFELGSFGLALAESGYLKIMAEGIHSLGPYSVQAYSFLKNFAVILRACVDLADHVHDFSKGYTTPIIPDSHVFTFYSDVYLLTITHG